MTTISSSESTRFGGNHGYRFDGDFVHLNAEVIFADADLGLGQNWAVQLWASEQGFDAGLLNGVKVAELAVFPVGGVVSVGGCCSALPPAGAASQVIALALVAQNGDGSTRLSDLAIYPADEAFSMPRLLGQIDCGVEGDAVKLTIGAIANPRPNDNLSGTLALEVWSLEAPYTGGSWSGTPVATRVLGTLAGGEQWSDCRFTIPGAMPDGAANLTVMLREWTPAGYVTRDFRNFAGANAAASAAPVMVKTEDKASVAVEKETGKSKKAPAKKAVKATVAAPKPQGIPVNTASEAELKAVKGISATVAKAIIAARPFATLDDLARVKGLGAKSLAKLGDQFVI